MGEKKQGYVNADAYKPSHDHIKYIPFWTLNIYTAHV